jgi:hypothetical protein
VKKAQVKEKMEELLLKVKGSSSPDAYYYGFKDGLEALLDWLIKSGVIEA